MPKRYNPQDITVPALCESLNSVIIEFPEDVKDPELQFLKLLQSFVRHHDHSRDVVLGVCVYIMEAITANCGFWSHPEKNPLFYQLLLKLDIHKKNELDDQSKVVYLTHLLNCIKEKNLDLEGSPAKTGNPLYKAVEGTIKKLIEKLRPQINELLMRLPAQNQLLKRFPQVATEYKKNCEASSTWLSLNKHSSRTQYVKFAEATQKQDTASPEVEEKRTEPDSDALYGMLIYFMLKIEKEYSLFSPARSLMYLECKRLANIESTRNLSNSDKRKYLSKLQSLVTDILATPKKIDALEKSGFVDAKKFLEEVSQDLSDILAGLTKSTDHGLTNLRLNTFVENLENTAAKTAAWLGITGLIYYVTKIPTVYDKLISSLFYVLPYHYVLMLEIMVYVQPISLLLGSSAVAYPTTALATPLLKPPAEFVHNRLPGLTFFNSPQVAENSAEGDKDFINALLLLPDEIFSQEDKFKLRMIFNIDEEKNQADNSLDQITVAKSAYL